MQDLTAHGLYGAPPPRQPSNNPAPAPVEAGGNVRTEARGGKAGDPTLWLVGLIGVAVALIASVRFELEVAA